MVEINNQRKAFLDMLAWSEGTDTWRWKPENHGYDVIVGGELFTDYSDHPRKLVTLNPKLKSTGAGRYQLLLVGGMPPSPSSLLKTSLRKVRTLWHCSRLRAWRFNGDWSWWYPSGNRPLQQYLGFTAAGRWLWSVHTRPTAWLQNSKKGRNGCQRDYASRVTAIISALLSASSSACHGLLITTVAAITYKAQRDKNAREPKLANAAITDMQMRQRDVAALDANTRRS